MFPPTSQIPETFIPLIHGILLYFFLSSIHFFWYAPRQTLATMRTKHSDGQEEADENPATGRMRSHPEEPAERNADGYSPAKVI